MWQDGHQIRTTLYYYRHETLIILKNCSSKQTNCEILKILRDASVESLLIILLNAIHLILVTSNFRDGTLHLVDLERISN